MASLKQPVQQISCTPEVVQALTLAGHSNSEIADLAGVNRTTIWRYLQKISEQKHIIKSVSDNMVDILLTNIGLTASVINRTMEYVANLSETDYSALPHSAKIGFSHVANSILGTAYDKYRLETGKSTQNIGINEVRSLSRQDLQDLAKVVLVERESRLFKDDQVGDDSHNQAAKQLPYQSDPQTAHAQDDPSK